MTFLRTGPSRGNHFHPNINYIQGKPFFENYQPRDTVPRLYARREHRAAYLHRLSLYHNNPLTHIGPEIATAEVIHNSAKPSNGREVCGLSQPQRSCQDSISNSANDVSEELQIQFSVHGIVGFAKWGLDVDVDSTRRAIDVVLRGVGILPPTEADQGACDADAVTSEEAGDHRLLAFLLTQNPTAVASWVEKLTEKFARLNSWRWISNFTLVDYQHRVRLVVRSRVVVEVIPFPPKRRAA